jgi:hypothetical protein
MDNILEQRQKAKEEFNKQLKLFNKKLDLELKNTKYRNNVEFREAVKRKNREHYHNVVKKRKEEELIDV